MKNVLIVAEQPHRFLDQLNFANMLSADYKNLNIYFFVGEKVCEAYKELLDNFNFIVINDVEKTCHKSDNCGGKHFYLARAKTAIKNILSIKQRQVLGRFIYYVENTKFFTWRLVALESKYTDFLNTVYKYMLDVVVGHNINIIFLNGDRHLGYEPIFLKIAKEMKISTVIPYLVDFADEERIFFNDVITKKISPSILTSKYVINSQERLSHTAVRESYYYPHHIANALYSFGTLTSNPYVMGSGCSDILCLNNQIHKDIYVKRGVGEHKIKVVGDISYDNLYAKFDQKNKIKEEICHKYVLDDNKQIAIVALPQLGEHNILPWDRHWEEINFLLNQISTIGVQIIVSLHPKMKRSEYEFLENMYQCRIADERLADILPVADLFVATYSSTVIWAVLCGVKTIVVDFYGLNYSMYNFLSSIKIVREKDELAKVLTEFKGAKIDFTDDWLSLSRNQVFDGRTIERYAELIFSLTDGLKKGRMNE